jgi:hypothetical protein
MRFVSYIRGFAVWNTEMVHKKGRDFSRPDFCILTSSDALLGLLPGYEFVSSMSLLACFVAFCDSVLLLAVGLRV